MAEHSIDQEQGSKILDVHIHNQNRAQAFIRTVITGIAVFIVSLGTAVVSQWDKIQSTVPDFRPSVINSWNVTEELVNLTNEVHLSLSVFILIIALFFAFDSIRVAQRVLRTRVSEYYPRELSGNPPGMDEIVQFQYSCLDMAYDLAETAVIIAAVGFSIGVLAIIGQAATLAQLDLLIVAMGLLLSILKAPEVTTNAVETLLWNSRFFEFQDNENRKDSHEKLEFYAPHHMVILAYITGGIIAFLSAGIIGIIWLIVAFQESIPSSDWIVETTLPLTPLITVVIGGWVLYQTMRRISRLTNENNIRFKSESVPGLPILQKLLTIVLDDKDIGE